MTRPDAAVTAIQFNDCSSYFGSISKAKLPSRLAWPIGAQAVKDHCEAYLEAKRLHLSFSIRQTLSTGRKPSTYLVVELEYSFRPAGLFDKRNEVRQPGWHFWVFAVPTDRRHSVRTALLATGFPQLVVPWIAQTLKHDGEFGEHRLLLDWDDSERLLLQRTFFKET